MALYSSYTIYKINRYFYLNLNNFHILQIRIHGIVILKIKKRDMKAIECADYDSMGNQGRFPKKTKKVEPSIFDRIAGFIKGLIGA